MGVDVLDPAAAAADEVMVVVAARVPEQGAAAAIDAVDDPKLLEQFQGRVDGGEEIPGRRALASSSSSSAEVAVALAQQPVHDESLRGGAEAALAEALAELLVAMGDAAAVFIGAKV